MKTLFLIMLLLCNFDVRVLYCPGDSASFNVMLGHEALNQNAPSHYNNLIPAHPTDNRKSNSNTKLESFVLGITALGLFYVYANTK